MTRFWRELRNKARRWRQADDGATAVEFALGAIVFFWVFMAIVELGMMMLFNNGLENGVDKASRLIRTGQADKRGLSAGHMRTVICNQVVLKGLCQSGLVLDVRSFRDFASINVPDANVGANGTLNLSSAYEIGGPKRVVVVRAFYPWRFFTPMVGKLMNAVGGKVFVLSAATAFRNEPYGS